MGLSFQAIIIAVIYAILTVVYVLAARPYNTLPKLQIAIGSVVWFIYVFMMIYDTNCLVNGHCVVWAWIRTVVYIILPTVMMILLLTIWKSGSKKAAEEKAKEEFKSAPKKQWF